MSETSAPKNTKWKEIKTLSREKDRVRDLMLLDRGRHSVNEIIWSENNISPKMKRSMIMQ